MYKRQIQRRANDMPKLKQVYGDRIGFNAFIEDMEADVKYSEEELRALMRKSIDIYAPGGGFYPVVFASTPEDLWTCATEIYCYSRELYDKENGR